MKILVIEDKEAHRLAAAQTLAGHDLVIVSTFDEAVEAMAPKIDLVLLAELCAKANHGEFPVAGSLSDQDAWERNRLELEERAVRNPGFDAVLVDMMMPMSAKTLGPGIYDPNVEVPYGFILVLMASRIGAKYIAMVTDTNHHGSPMSAALDKLGSAYYNGDEKPFIINGAKCLFLHAPFLEDTVRDAKCDCCTDGKCPTCGGTKTVKWSSSRCNMCVDGKCNNCNGTGRAAKKIYNRKNWGVVLKHLIR